MQTFVLFLPLTAAAAVAPLLASADLWGAEALDLPRFADAIRARSDAATPVAIIGERGTGLGFTLRRPAVGYDSVAEFMDSPPDSPTGRIALVLRGSDAKRLPGGLMIETLCDSREHDRDPLQLVLIRRPVPAENPASRRRPRRADESDE